MVFTVLFVQASVLPVDRLLDKVEIATFPRYTHAYHMTDIVEFSDMRFLHLYIRDGRAYGKIFKKGKYALFI